MKSNCRQNGISLLELTIILVVIGLVFGAILTGQEMIRVANLRSVTAQFNQYQAAANTFYVKFLHYPGDMPANIAQTYELTGGTCSNISVAGCAGDGDRNFIVEEMVGLFYHISKAGLIKETLTDYTTVRPVNLVAGAGYGFEDSVPLQYPATSLDDGTDWFVMNWLTDDPANPVIPMMDAYVDNLALGLGVDLEACIYAVSYGGDGGYHNLTPADARWIDAKLDDGYGDLGNVQLWDDGIAPGAGLCNDGSRGYNLTNPDTNLCNLKLKLF